ncbi:HPP family protein [Catenovulum sp. 2E275]|uniref:HPP family protein n=1 Tax=Catenovulum sp. 2E275 TaxID=2980497 RepID=UPI0021D3076A|nr:HPP family protein [Catenovulum sp. 2E275]MCU4674251.1 HPP family protein [Catenovulum sp. 2E275]
MFVNKVKNRVTYLLKETRLFLGLEASTTSHAEKIISGIGAILGILFTQKITLQYFDPHTSLFLVGSMGATAVLIFALPHGVLSQPWNVFAGHILSAIVGVSCQQLVQDPYLAAALAVGLAICVMHYTHSLHPPGGATALFCVMGGEQVHQLGFNFIYTPLLLNLVCLMLIAFTFNLCFHWRRYPAHLNFAGKTHTPSSYQLSQEDFTAALRQQNSYIDVSSEELAEIFSNAIEHAQNNKPQKRLTISLNHYYSNAGLGEYWSVRQVIEIRRTQLKYKVVAGNEAGTTGETYIKSFKKWAKHEVHSVDKHWMKRP